MRKNTYDRINEVIALPIAQKVQRIIIILTILLIAFDIYWAIGGEGTISSVIRENALENHIWLPWVWGVITGHLFFDRTFNVPMIEEFQAIIILVILTIVFAILGLFFQLNGADIYLQGFLLFIGFIAGYFLWPQKTRRSTL